MNAISPVSLPAANCDAAYSAACAVHADAHIGAAMDEIGDRIGAIYAQRRALTEAEARVVVGLRSCLVALSHARNLLEPLTKGRVQ